MIFGWTGLFEPTADDIEDKASEDDSLPLGQDGVFETNRDDSHPKATFQPVYILLRLTHPSGMRDSIPY